MSERVFSEHDLRPCPACGAGGQLQWKEWHDGLTSHGRGRIRCTSCGVHGPVVEGPQARQCDALDQWNAMPRRDDRDAEVEALQTQLEQAQAATRALRALHDFTDEQVARLLGPGGADDGPPCRPGRVSRGDGRARRGGAL